MLKTVGFRTLRRRIRENNCVFDTADLALRRAGALLRVRQAGRLATLTYKGPAVPGKYKSREELEIEISDAATGRAILERLGFRLVFRYEKYRTEYTQPRAPLKGGGIVTLDETPIGCYLELEGGPRWIDRTARALVFTESDYITASYARLYQEFCEARHIRPGDMLFAGKVRRERPRGRASSGVSPR